jgi:Mrp family chromosome partitioning ATPase/predicted Fe-Mo cluster-binding NifX family protein
MSEKTCGSCSSQSGCQSNKTQQQNDEKLNQCLGRIKNKLVVMSGKGGVGKSSVATNIAVALSMAGQKVGLLDVDVHGPSVPRILNLGDVKPEAGDGTLMPVRWSDNLSVMSLGFLLPNKEDSVIWRGPIKMHLIRQFLEEVAWGELDYLVVDCPPGTGDEPISVMQLLGTDARAIIVTTPQVLAIDDVRRSVNFCTHTGNPVLGVIENMSGFVCPHCQQTVDIFNTGGGEKLAAECGVPFLGRIPLDPEMVRSGDMGYAYIKTYDHTPTAQAINAIVKPLLNLSGTLQDHTARGQNPVQTPATGDNGHLRIALPVADGKLCMHFGHCQQFAMVNVNQENKTIESVDMLNPPPHEPGVLPQWLAEQKANLIIAGGMGSRAQSLFTQNGIRVLTGAPAGTPEELVQAYLNGSLVTGDNVCDH